MVVVVVVVVATLPTGDGCGCGCGCGYVPGCVVLLAASLPTAGAVPS
jgi:hypothetical protein